MKEILLSPLAPIAIFGMYAVFSTITFLCGCIIDFISVGRTDCVYQMLNDVY